MGFSVGTLANYTKENEALLVASSVLGSKTASLIKDKGNVMVGVKSAETINIMDTDAIFQDGSSCGLNHSSIVFVFDTFNCAYKTNGSNTNF